MKFSHTSLRGLLHNMAGLYGLYFSGYVLALVTVPYLARILGPAGWGLLSMVQAFSGFVLLCVEFGFALTGTADVARLGHNARGRGSVLTEILCARACVSLLCIAACVLVQAVTPPFLAHSRLYWSGVFWAVAQGNSLLWFYQGIERSGRYSIIDLAIKSIAVLGIFITVSASDDAWLVMTINGCAALVSFAVALCLATSEAPLCMPTTAGVRSHIVRGAILFAPRNAGLMFAVLNTFILGLLAPTGVVGSYSGAERVNRAALGLLGPSTDALYARMSALRPNITGTISRAALRAVTILLALGILISLALWVSAPAVIAWVLGSKYTSAVPVLQILALLLPLVALSNGLGTTVLVPLGCERRFAGIVIGSGILNVVLAVIWGSMFGAEGAAWATVAAHTALAAATVLAVLSVPADSGSASAGTPTPAAV